MREASLRRSLRLGIAVLVAVNAGIGYAVVTGDQLVLLLLIGAACLYLLWAVVTGPGEDVGRTAGRANEQYPEER
jgi:uncharacterized membrane protein